MTEMKVSEEVLKQIQVRLNVLRSNNILLQMADKEFKLYLAEQVRLLGLDVNVKDYHVDENTGIVTEVPKQIYEPKNA